MSIRIEGRGLGAEARGLRIELPSPACGRGVGGEGDSTPHIPCSPALGTRSSGGFTLIELIVVIIIVVVLAGAFLIRVPYYQEQAEKAAMQQVVGALQSALMLRYGALMTRGAANEQELSILATDNPMTWLQQKPRNYAGEYYDPSPRAVAPGNWMFDLKSRDLIYVLDHGDYFTPGKDGNKWIRFHVRLQYEPVLGGGVQAAGKKELVGTLLVPADTYRWFD